MRPGEAEGIDRERAAFQFGGMDGVSCGTSIAGVLPWQTDKAVCGKERKSEACVDGLFPDNADAHCHELPSEHYFCGIDWNFRGIFGDVANGSKKL